MHATLDLPFPDFLAAIKSLSEEQAWELLALEKNGRGRLTYLQRLYSRANALRAKRELRAWLGD